MATLAPSGLTPEEEELRFWARYLNEGGEGLRDFIARVCPTEPAPPHLTPLIDAMERCRLLGHQRLAVSFPPRHGKTVTLRRAIAWWLQSRPADCCAYVSRTADGASAQSRKVRFLAKGARRMKSALQGSLMTGSVSEIVFYWRPERGLQLLKEIETVGPYEAALGDLERLCLFQAGLEIVDRSVVENESDERVFDMMETFMRLLPAAADPWALFYAFEIGVLKLAGSFPATASCAHCRRTLENEAFSIDPASGLVSCASCRLKGRALTRGSSALVARLDRFGFEGVREARMSRGERRGR